MIYKCLILLLPFVLTCIPGYQLSETTTIQSFDIYFAVILPLSFIGSSHNKTYSKINKLMKLWLLFFFVAIVSTIINSLSIEFKSNSAYLKTYRLLYPIILIAFLTKHSKYLRLKSFEKAFLLSMMISPIIGIIGYIQQIPGFIAIQTAQYDGSDVVFSRASSYWQEAGIFGVISSFFILLSIIGTMKGGKLRILYIAALFLNVVALFFSGTRSGAIIIVVALAYLSFSFGKKYFFRFASALAVLLVLIVFLSKNDETGVFNYYLQRMLDVATITSNNAGDVSSTRTVQWVNTFNSFLNSNPFNLLLGYGYKTEIFRQLTDNGYLYILISLGAVGLVIFTYFLYQFYKLDFHDKEGNFINNANKFAFLTWIVSMLFADTLTYIPVLLFPFLFCFLKIHSESYENSI